MPQLVGQARQVSEFVASIAASTAEQATERNAALAQQGTATAAAAATSLCGQAGELFQAAAVFKLDPAELIPAH